MDIRVTLILALEAVLALWLLYKMRLLRTPVCWTAAVALTLLAFAARYSVLDYVTLDYRDFLSRWVEYFRVNGGFVGLSRQIGNYNIPYLYFLALFFLQQHRRPLSHKAAEHIVRCAARVGRGAAARPLHK